MTGRGRLWARCRGRRRRSAGGRHAGGGTRRGGRAARFGGRPGRVGAGVRRRDVTVRSEFTALVLGGAQVVDPAEFLADDGRVQLGLGPATSPPAALTPRVAPLVGAVRRPLRTTRHHY